MTLRELQAKHNTGHGRTALNRELRAAQPGGSELLDSLADIARFFAGRDQSAGEAAKVLNAVKLKLSKAAQLFLAPPARQPPGTAELLESLADVERFLAAGNADARAAANVLGAANLKLGKAADLLRKSLISE